jgi:hypothetical protein
LTFLEVSYHRGTTTPWPAALQSGYMRGTSLERKPDAQLVADGVEQRV